MYRNLISILIGVFFIVGGLSVWVMEIQANDPSTSETEQQQIKKQQEEMEDTPSNITNTDEKDETLKPRTDTQEQPQVNVLKTFTADGYRQVLTKQLDEDTQVTVNNEYTPDGKQYEWSAEVKLSLDNDGKLVRILKKTAAVVTYIPKKIGQGVVFVSKGIKKLFWRR